MAQVAQFNGTGWIQFRYICGGGGGSGSGVVCAVAGYWILGNRSATNGLALCALGRVSDSM